MSRAIKSQLIAVFYLFFLMGVAALGTGIVLGIQTVTFLGKARSTTGEVVELVPHRGRRTTTYTLAVTYPGPDGQTHRLESSWSSSSPGYQPGDPITVRYDPDDASDARVGGVWASWGPPGLACGIGLLFAGIGGGFILAHRRRRRLRDWLLAHGTRIQARYLGTERKGSIKVNGREPWQLACQWQNPGTGAVHTFLSEDIWYDPGPFVDRQELDVLIDPHDPRRHHVDIGFLPEHHC